MHVLEWLEGLKELGEDDGKEVAIQKELVQQLKMRARTLEIAVTKGWHIGISKSYLKVLAFCSINSYLQRNNMRPLKIWSRILSWPCKRQSLLVVHLEGPNLIFTLNRTLVVSFVVP